MIDVGDRDWCQRMVDLGGSDFSTQADRSRLLVGCKTRRESKVFFLILQRITVLMCMCRNFNFHLLPNKSGEEFSVPSFSLSIVGILGKNSYLKFFSFGSRCKRVAGNSVLLSASLNSARGSRQWE